VYLSANTLRPYLNWTTACQDQNLNNNQGDLPDVTTTISPALAHLKNTCARDKERQAPKEPTEAGVGATCLSVDQLNRKCRHPHKYDDIQAVLLE